MIKNPIEHWVCSENIARYRKMLSEPPNNGATQDQVQGLLTRELAKMRAMVPN